MDAFVQRSPHKLFVRDRFVLWSVGDKADDSLVALVAGAGGRVVDAGSSGAKDASDGSAPLLVVVPDAPPSSSGEQADSQGASDDMLRAQLRFPQARIVAAAWVRDCVARKTRLPTATYELQARKASAVVTVDTASAESGEPPKKRVKATANAVAGFFGGPVSSATVGNNTPVPKPHFRPWQSVDGGSLLVLDARPLTPALSTAGASLKVSSFDLDGTLIVTKSGKRFAQSDSDWQWFHPTRVPLKLAELLADGHHLVLFSNQNGVEKGKVSAADVQRKVSAIVAKLGLPMLVFLATRDDLNRKPRVNAWARMVEMLQPDGASTVSKSESFYCGDAAGRPKVAGRAKDFAATDYKFALNLDVPFLTPEALFLGSKQRLHTHPGEWDIGFDPRAIPVAASPGGPVLIPASAELTTQHQELVVLAGSPASGKSHLAASCFPAYVVVSQDDLRTLANCKKACLEALADGKSVVVDGTNRSKPTRKEWIALAQNHNVRIRCFEMDVPKPLAMHLNTFRAITTAKKIPDVAIHGFYKNYTQPEVAEGFEKVVKVQLRLDRAGLSAEHLQLVSSFL